MWSVRLAPYLVVVTRPNHGGDVVVLTPQNLVTIEAGLVLGVTVVTVSSVHDSAGHLKLYFVLLDAVNLHREISACDAELQTNVTDPIEMTVQTVLTRVLLAALRADHVRVLVLEMNILNVSFKRHLVEI